MLRFLRVGSNEIKDEWINIGKINHILPIRKTLYYFQTKITNLKNYLFSDLLVCLLHFTAVVYIHFAECLSQSFSTNSRVPIAQGKQGKWPKIFPFC